MSSEYVIYSIDEHGAVTDAERVFCDLQEAKARAQAKAVVALRVEVWAGPALMLRIGDEADGSELGARVGGGF